MRIVAGQWGGRRLQAPAGQGTRPTADRVREALFSALGDIEGDRVLDLFAGSGALGLEALSRGAAKATFVERDETALRALRANVDALGADAEILRRDALGFLTNAAGGPRHYDLALLDPPYHQAGNLTERLGELLGPLLAPGARVVCESDRRAPLRLDLPIGFERTYGDTLILIHTAP